MATVRTYDHISIQALRSTPTPDGEEIERCTTADANLYGLYEVTAEGLSMHIEDYDTVDEALTSARALGLEISLDLIS